MESLETATTSMSMNATSPVVDNGNETSAASTSSNNNNNNKLSALQDNIERKGKNAYYFAHSHKANGPKWDGKAEPRLLSRSNTHEGTFATTNDKSGPLAFEYNKSSITTYAFMNEEKRVKLYIDLENVGEQCTQNDNDVTLDYTETSLCLIVKNYKKVGDMSESNNKQEHLCLSFGKLTAPISSASYKIKPHRIILTLVKATPGVEWYTINDKGEPDHEVV